MTGSGFDHDERVDLSPNAATAARLLADAERVGARARAQTDYRAHAVIQAWSAVSEFVFVATFLILAGTAGANGLATGTEPPYVSYGWLLLIAFHMVNQLEEGASDRLPISAALPRRRVMLLLLPGLALVLAATAASLFGITYPWWAYLLVAAAVSAPLGGLAISTARNARGTAPHGHEASPRPPLSRQAAKVTAVLGVIFGIIAASSAYPWFPAVMILLTFLMAALLRDKSTPWGLPSIGSEWGQSQWVAFGVTVTALFALVIVDVKTPWNTPLVATIGGIAIAMPLVLSTLRTHRRP